jgi:type VI secretion system protein ImpK
MTTSIEHRRGLLALTLQEPLTAAVRLRANRQVAADAESFRTHIKQLLGQSDQDARRAGYDGDTVKLAVYAVIVFIDESVLNSQQPMFAEWPRKPLQEEVFGGHMGGEVFFQYLTELLGRPDSNDVADLLEVFQLTLLLGFVGRYGARDKGELHGLTQQTGEKIRRIRGGDGSLSPAWAPPTDEVIPIARDPWVRRLGYTAAALFAVALVFWVIFDLSLRTGINDLAALLL